MFTVITVYETPTGKRIVHCWGIYSDQREAINAKNRHKAQTRRENSSYDTRLERLTYHISEVKDDAYFNRLNRRLANG